VEKGALSILSDKEVEGDGTLSQRAFHLFRKPRLSKQLEEYSHPASEAIEKLYEGRARALGPDWFHQPQEMFGRVDEWVAVTLSDASLERKLESAKNLALPTEDELVKVIRHGSIRDLVNMAFRIADQDVPKNLSDSLEKEEGSRGDGSSKGDKPVEDTDGEEGASKPDDLLDDVEDSEESSTTWTPHDGDEVLDKIGREFDYPLAHSIEVENVRQIPVTLEIPTKSAVEVSSTMGTSTMRYVGSPSSRVWQANYGNFRVFNKPTRSQPRVMLFVDLSGSMNCWCKTCNKSRSFPSRGYLAFQAAAAISAVHPKTEVYGFGSLHDNSRNPGNKILPLKPGYSPECRNIISVPNGNNDCSMLLWLENQMQGQEQDTVAIVISDGQPAGICGSPHTAKLSRLFVDRGMKLASILIGTNHSLYPAEVTAEVNTLDDMANIWPVLSFVASQER